MMSGLLSFTSPWLLAGLLALPLIWWLLRLMPPAPVRIVFPPARLLAGLLPTERTPARSPWWLTALRILTAALIVLALAEPFYATQQSAATDGRPVLLLVDNDWAAASRWKARQQYIANIIRRAERDNQPVYLAPSTGLPAGWQPQPLTPEEARNAAAALEPLPVPPARSQQAQALKAGLNATGLTVIWLSNGVNDPGAADLLQAAQQAASGGGSLTLVGDAPQDGALGLFGFLNTSRQLTARVLTTGDVRAGTVTALSARGEHLGAASFSLPQGSRRTEVALDLPVALQNQVAQLEISGEASAGAVFLLDSRSFRHRAGIISGEATASAQPLLSPTHYIEKALSPFAEILQPQSGNVDEATSALLEQKPSVLVLADIGRLVEPVETRLKRWIEKGGLLIRFAGVHMEQGGGDLSPARLRQGGRTLGGALSWSTPQELAAFEKNSPFFGLTVPPEVNVNRQILADPSALDAKSEVWARLRDGTPLVTAEKFGAGRIVLFHVTGNPDWSNLPLSGMFVDMLRRILEQAATAMNVEENSETATAADAKTAGEAGGYLVPWRTLDGYGRLGAPKPQTKAIPAAGFAKQPLAPDTPPGFYGPAGNTRALNLLSDKTQLEPLAATESVTRASYGKDVSVFFGPWLWLAALALFMADALATLLLMSAGRIGGFLKGGAVAALAAMLAAGLCFSPAPADAGSVKKLPSDGNISAATMDGALQTRLAYVITGDAAIDEISRAGLAGLSKVLAARTAVEPAEPMGVNAVTDELSVFPLLYWPVLASPAPLNDAVLAKIDAFMKNGGMILFDTRDSQMPLSGVRGSAGDGGTPLATLLSKLDVPRLEPVSDEHVVTKSFYLLRSFPGRWDAGELWVEAQTNISDTQTRRALKSDGVSSILVTSNDLAAAWALDDANRPQFPVVPGGEEQREMAYRVGVNIVMYALTGNYKADQVHIPALLERLGH